MTVVKICGLTRPEDCNASIAAGATMLGLNFWNQSSRFVAPESATTLVETASGNATWVGLFVDAEPDWVRHVMSLVPLDILQFHGHETPQYCRQFQRPFMKAFRLKNESTLKHIPDFLDDSNQPFLVDAYVPHQPGGTGHVINMELANKAKDIPGKMVLAGGLNPNNVEAMIDAIDPYGVDVASGVESEPGLKDHTKIKAFLAAAGVDAE